MGEIHRDAFGAGTPAVFIHGSFGWGLDTFPEQRELADTFQVVLVDRRGYGRSADAGSDGWPTDHRDLIDLLERIGPAHVVGQSYGAVVALLAASLRPELARSLVTIEPPLFSLLPEDPEAGPIAAAAAEVFAGAAAMDVGAFVAAFGQAVFGRSPEATREMTRTWSDADWVAADATRRERPPGDAPVEWDRLRAASFPKVMAVGAWLPTLGFNARVGRAFRAVADEVAGRIGADVVVFERSTHNPQMQEAAAFNERLRALAAPGP